VRPIRERTSWVPLLGAPAIGLVLVLSWLLPLAAWAIATIGVASSVIFVLVVSAHRGLGRRLFLKPAVAAALVMYAIALFTLAYAALALEQVGSIQTNGSGRPQSLGVAALVATAMGIGGGEVGAQVRDGARVIAHIQLLLVIGAVAGVGGQLVQRLAGAPAPNERQGPREPHSPVFDLYTLVFNRLTENEGETALNDAPAADAETRRRLKQSLRSLPHPSRATEGEAMTVFRRINAGDLEYFYSIPLAEESLGVTVRSWLDRLG